MAWFVSGKKTETFIQEYPEIKVKERLKKIEITGNSRMTNPGEYYDELTGQMMDYFNTFGKTLFIEFRFEFINSTSILLLLRMLHSLQNLADKNGMVEATWSYEEDDESIRETGEIFSSSLKIPFHLKEIPS